MRNLEESIQRHLEAKYSHVEEPNMALLQREAEEVHDWIVSVMGEGAASYNYEADPRAWGYVYGLASSEEVGLFDAQYPERGSLVYPDYEELVESYEDRLSAQEFESWFTSEDSEKWTSLGNYEK